MRRCSGRGRWAPRACRRHRVRAGEALFGATFRRALFSSFACQPRCGRATCHLPPTVALRWEARARELGRPRVFVRFSLSLMTWGEGGERRHGASDLGRCTAAFNDQGGDFGINSVVVVVNYTRTRPRRARRQPTTQKPRRVLVAHNNRLGHPWCRVLSFV